MKLSNFCEIFFMVTGGLAMPFIVIGSYFTTIPKDQRNKLFSWFFLIISIIYALTYSYFAWEALKRSDNWKRIQEENKK